MTSAVRRPRAALVAAVLVLAAPLAACSSGKPDASSSSDRSRSAAPSSPGSSAPGASSGSSSPGSASPTEASRPAAPPAPRLRACYLLSTAQLTQPTNQSRPVSCSGRHTAQTVYVGRLDTVVDGHSVAVDSETVQRQLQSTCPRKLSAYLGGSGTARALSRFNVVWYSPTLEQSDAGADWFRCDAIAFAGTDQLYPLPDTKKLAGVLGDGGALDTYGLCGTAAPGERGFERVICGRKHSWRAFTTVGLPSGGDDYPGTDAVRRGGDDQCKKAAQARAKDKLKFRYGWEWPSRAQWERNQHYGYCWVPDPG